MHIAMLSAEFPPRWGGMGSTVFHLSAALANRGHRVTVITRSGAGKPPDQEGVDVIEVGWARIPMEFTRSYGRRAISELERLNERLCVKGIEVFLSSRCSKSEKFEFFQNLKKSDHHGEDGHR